MDLAFAQGADVAEPRARWLGLLAKGEMCTGGVQARAIFGAGEPEPDRALAHDDGDPSPPPTAIHPRTRYPAPISLSSREAWIGATHDCR